MMSRWGQGFCAVCMWLTQLDHVTEQMQREVPGRLGPGSRKMGEGGCQFLAGAVESWGRGA